MAFTQILKKLFGFKVATGRTHKIMQEKYILVRAIGTKQKTVGNHTLFDVCRLQDW